MPQTDSPDGLAEAIAQMAAAEGVTLDDDGGDHPLADIEPGGDVQPEHLDPVDDAEPGFELDSKFADEMLGRRTEDDPAAAAAAEGGGDEPEQPEAEPPPPPTDWAQRTFELQQQQLQLQQARFEAEQRRQYEEIQRQQQQLQSPEAFERQMEEGLRSAGLDPADPLHRLVFETHARNQQLEAHLSQQQQMMQQWQQQAYQMQAEQAAAPAIQQVLQGYEVPEAYVQNAARQVAGLVAAGYDQQQAIQAALAPVAPLLEAMKAAAPQQRKPAPPPQTKTPPQKAAPSRQPPGRHDPAAMAALKAANMRGASREPSRTQKLTEQDLLRIEQRMIEDGLGPFGAGLLGRR